MEKENFLAATGKKRKDVENNNELLIETFPIDMLEDIGLNKNSTVEDLIDLRKKHPLPSNFDGDKMLKEIGEILGIDYFDDNT